MSVPTGRKHVSVKSLPNASDVEAVVLTHIIRDVAQHINNAFDKQPESKPLTNEDGVNPTRISALLSGLPVSTTESSKDVRTSNGAVTHNNLLQIKPYPLRQLNPLTQNLQHLEPLLEPLPIIQCAAVQCESKHVQHAHFIQKCVIPRCR